MCPAGSGEGVTNASITPETSSTTIKPSAIVSEERPSSASARPRGRGPGSMMLQPRRSPAAAARNTAVSSSIPCGRIRVKNRPPRPCATIRPPSTPALAAFPNSTTSVGSPSSTPKISASAATHTLLVHTFAANELAAYCE